MEENPKILIVDDERFNINVLTGFLKSFYKIMVAKNGQQALKAAHSGKPPDLILLDIMMPDMDGYEVCKRLKSNPDTREIPIIFITAKGAEDDEAKGFELGAVDYITKPIRPAVVMARVKTHLSLRSAYRELEQKNLALLEMDRLKQDVEHITRHDMKSPLTGAIGFASLLLAKESINAEDKEFVKIIYESSVNALHMVNLSLGLYRMEQGTYELEARDVNIVPILRNVFAVLEILMGMKQLTLEIRLQDRAVTETDRFVVLGEELLCYSILTNLIKNAAEASPKGKPITISMRYDTMAFVAVHNFGVVPPEIQERFFEKYATSGKKSGTGLGTYSARLMTEAQKGSIDMETSEQKGTTITINLPQGRSDGPS